MDFSPKLKHKLVTEKKHLMALLINDNEASAQAAKEFESIKY